MILYTCDYAAAGPGTFWRSFARWPRSDDNISWENSKLSWETVFRSVPLATWSIRHSFQGPNPNVLSWAGCRLAIMWLHVKSQISLPGEWLARSCYTWVSEKKTADEIADDFPHHTIYMHIPAYGGFPTMRDPKTKMMGVNTKLGLVFDSCGHQPHCRKPHV